MKQRNRILMIVLAGALFSVSTSCQFREPGENADLLRITGNIVCDCGCPPTLVRACSCSRAEQMTAEVRGLLDEGKTEEEIYAHYVAQIGPQVLAAPKAEGFNLLGWIFPFLAAISGGAIVAAVYHSLKRKKAMESADAGPPLGAAATEKYREMLAREMAE
jgi:cytochrome c-type biogenesis protein CcmH/NrfF